MIKIKTAETPQNKSIGFYKFYSLLQTQHQVHLELTQWAHRGRKLTFNIEITTNYEQKIIRLGRHLRWCPHQQQQQNPVALGRLHQEPQEPAT